MENAKRKENKQQLVKDWEENFGLKLENELSEEGLKKFWSDDTWCHEAFGMLIGATVNHALNSIADDLDGEIVGVIVKKEVPDEEPCNVKNGTPYKIARVNDGKIVHVEDEEFETEEAAKAKIQERVNHSTHTLSDFCVIQVQVCK